MIATMHKLDRKIEHKIADFSSLIIRYQIADFSRLIMSSQKRYLEQMILFLEIFPGILSFPDKCNADLYIGVPGLKFQPPVWTA